VWNESVKNKGWARLVALFKKTCAEMGTPPDEHVYVLCIDPETEMDLLDLEAWEVGEMTMGRILEYGPRGAFDRILGYEVKWRCKQLEFAKRRAE
jgi:hypothetical protein